MNDQNKSKHNGSRRKFIKTAAYTAPVVLTLKAAPTFATSGSHCPHHDPSHTVHACGHHN